VQDAEKSICFGDTGISPFPHLAAATSRCLIVFGDNADGKSLFLMVLRAFVSSRKKFGDEAFELSMKQRTAPGMGALIYGDERFASTGANSVSTLINAFKNCRDRKNSVWLMLDEPDIGLSDKFAGAQGAYIAQQINDMPKNVRGVVVVSHSRPLLRNLVATLEEAPHDVAMGSDRTLADFLDPENQDTASVEDLLSLPERAITTFRSVSEVLG
jgi:hypothetical protein